MLHSRIFTFNPLGTNCVVLWEDGQKACTVVDPGMSSADGARDLFDYFERQGLTPDAILLTHGHFDHIFGVGELTRCFSIPVWMSPEDKFILERDGEYATGVGLRAPEAGFQTRDIHEGQVMEMGFKVISTPGHTPGCVCFYSEQAKILLSGDTLFAGVDKDLMEIDGILAKGYFAASGGDAVNAAISMARLGLKTAICAAIGKDSAALLVKGELEQDGVDCSHLYESADVYTASPVLLIDSEGERHIIRVPDNGNQFFTESMVSDELLENSRHLHKTFDKCCV